MPVHYNLVRVGVDNWLQNDKFNNLLTFLKQNSDFIDSVTLFTNNCHSPMTLETAESRCDILKKRISEIKKIGFHCGINNLATLGHHEQYLDESLNDGFRNMQNIDGKKCLGSYCPDDENYKNKYLKKLYSMFADIEPDHIWIDDDIRYNHFPIGIGCFCDECIRKFNWITGNDFSRDELKSVLNSQENIDIRKSWLDFQGEKIENLLGFLADVVYGKNEKIKLGLMTGERYYEGFNFKAWAKALSKDGKHKIMWRPGGGAYNDLNFDEFIVKSNEIGRQVANLPEYADEIYSEIESFPYHILKKSPRSTAIESILYIATGCNKTAYNVLPNVNEGDSITLANSLFKTIKKSAPFMKILSETFGRGKTLGIYDGWSVYGQAVASDFFSGYGGENSRLTETTYNFNEFDLLGLPHSFDFESAEAFLLKGKQPLAFSDEQIKYMLSKTVYLDGDALDILCNKGYEEYLGFSLKDTLPADVKEVNVKASVNEGIENISRSCFAVFNKDKSYSLNCADNSEIICEIRNNRDERVVDCSLGKFENSLGGTVYCASYFPWSDICNTAKSTQIKRIFGKVMPAYISSYHRVRIYVRQTGNGFAILLFNCNFDTLENVEIAINTDKENLCLIEENGEKSTVNCIKNLEGKKVFLIRELKPYSFCIVNNK